MPFILQITKMTQGDEEQDVDISEEKLTFINGKLVTYDGAELHKKDKKTGEFSFSDRIDLKPGLTFSTMKVVTKK